MRLIVFALALAACPTDSEPTTSETGDTPTPTEPGTNSTGAERVATILALEPDSTSGAQTYSMYCAACHGVDGSGLKGNPALTDRVPSLSADEIVTTLLEGKGNMDSYKSLKNQDIANVLDHVMMSFGSGM